MYYGFYGMVGREETACLEDRHLPAGDEVRLADPRQLLEDERTPGFPQRGVLSRSVLMKPNSGGRQAALAGGGPDGGDTEAERA